jgi:hypothetical protein
MVTVFIRKCIEDVVPMITGFIRKCIKDVVLTVMIRSYSNQNPWQHSSKTERENYLI